MFVFDLFKDQAGRLHVIIGVVAGGMLVLLGGLWFVQIVCARQFETDLQRQSIRHVRTPAIRGRILDCNGVVLADDKPRYNAILYLEDLQPQFSKEYGMLRSNYALAHPGVINSRHNIVLPTTLRQRLQLDADCAVVSNITYRVSTSLDEPRALNREAFLRHYANYPYVPFQIVPSLAPNQVAIMAEQWLGQSPIDMETQPVREYPYHSLAAHLLGYVLRRDTTESGKFSFDMPDYEGVSGVESAFDERLRGQPGDKSVLINNLNYRQREEIETPNLPGDDIYLTIDARLQRAAEQALAEAKQNVRGAVVVMDPRNGDILALVSAPSFDPNIFVLHDSDAIRQLDNPKTTPQLNRAVNGAYPPGSTFKIITAIACLEDGLDPDAQYDSPGIYYATAASRPIRDLAGPGLFNLERAFYRSSNTYFIAKGKDKLAKILEVARRFHLGEKTGLSSSKEVAGDMPAAPRPGLSAPDVCIGQEVTATPLQMADMISVIANGGTLYEPRVVSHARLHGTDEMQQLVAPGRVRDHVQINPLHLARIRHAMLEDTEHAPDTDGAGSAYAEFHFNGAPLLGSFHVAGKTGTAEVKSVGSPYRRITWFDSYGPYEDPRYVVVVMVEDGFFGGPTCAPVAEKIYKAILQREQPGRGRPAAMARN